MKAVHTHARVLFSLMLQGLKKRRICASMAMEAYVLTDRLPTCLRLHGRSSDGLRHEHKGAYLGDELGPQEDAPDEDGTRPLIQLPHEGKGNHIPGTMDKLSR